MPYVIGVDIGSQSTKGVLLDPDGRCVQTAGRPLRMSYPRAGWAEQAPAEWEASLAEVVRELVAGAGIEPRDVAALALACQVDGVVAVDAAMRALRPAIIWLDRRAERQAARLEARLGADAIFGTTGLVPDASHSGPKMMWLRDHEPEAFALTAALAPVAAYLVGRLTGTLVQDPANASSTLLFDVVSGMWSTRLCEAAGLDPDLLPPVRPATEIAGHLTTRAAETLGLTTATAVCVGTGDDHGAALAAGAIGPGVIADVTGTAEPVAVATRKPVFDPGHLVETHAHAVDGDRDALAVLAELLTLSGLSMGVAQRTSPSSGMEHLVSHMLDMHSSATGRPAASHGSQVGVGALVASATWARVRRALAEGGPGALSLPEPDEARERVEAAFLPLGPTGAAAAECWDAYRTKLGCTAGLKPVLQGLVNHWAPFDARVEPLLAGPDRLVAAQTAIGAPTRFRDLEPGFDAGTARWAITNAHLMRDRFTVADLADLLGLGGPEGTEAVLDELTGWGRACDRDRQPRAHPASALRRLRIRPRRHRLPRRRAAARRRCGDRGDPRGRAPGGVRDQQPAARWPGLRGQADATRPADRGPRRRHLNRRARGLSRRATSGRRRICGV